jgi:hypothetical protein
MSRLFLVVGILLALLLGGGAWIWAQSQQPVGTEEEQILGQMLRAQQAAQAADIAALIRVVSSDYRDDLGLTRPTLRYEAGRQMREAQRIDVTIPSNGTRIQLSPDRREAISNGPVELRITDRQGEVRTVSLTPTLHWRKEQFRRYLIFPAEEWRIAKAEGVAQAAE